MASIVTVRGEIAPEELGTTSLHEHLNGDMRLLQRIALAFGTGAPPASMLTLANENLAFLRSGASIFSEESMTSGDVAYTAAELGHFRGIGGRAVVDASPIGIRGDVRELRAASELADVHVVTATGLYTAANRPEAYDGWTREQQVELFRRELLEGIDGSGIRAGILKCGLSATDPSAMLGEVELTTLRACAEVANETGASLHVHSAFPMTTDHVLQGLSVLIDEMSVPADRIVMMHMDSFLRGWRSRREYLEQIDSVKSVDVSLALRVLDRGANIGLDSWGSTVELLPQDDDRLKGLVELVRRGYDGQIGLGHDVTQKPQGVSYGATGFTWFPQLVQRTFAELGLPEEHFRRMTIEAPARILAF